MVADADRQTIVGDLLSVGAGIGRIGKNIRLSGRQLLGNRHLRADRYVGDGDGSAVLQLDFTVGRATDGCHIGSRVGSGRLGCRAVLLEVAEAVAGLTVAEVDGNISVKLIVGIDVADPVDRFLGDSDVPENGGVDIIRLQLGEIVGIAGIVDQLDVLRADVRRAGAVAAVLLGGRRGGIVKVFVGSCVFEIGIVRLLRHLDIAAGGEGSGEFLFAAACQIEVLGNGAVGRGEVEGSRRCDLILQTGVDVNRVDLLGDDHVVAERNHGELHLAVTLKQTALHVEHAHGVGVIGVEVEGLDSRVAAAVHRVDR